MAPFSLMIIVKEFLNIHAIRMVLVLGTDTGIYIGIWTYFAVVVGVVVAYWLALSHIVDDHKKIKKKKTCQEKLGMEMILLCSFVSFNIFFLFLFLFLF